MTERTGTLTRLGVYLRLLRLVRKMSTLELAKQLGYTRDYLLTVESGHSRPSLTMIERVIHVLKLSPAQSIKLRGLAQRQIANG